MIDAHAEATIERSADEIWSYAADIARHPQWMAVSTAEALAGRGDRVDDRGRERMRFGPITRDVEFTVVVAEPGRRVVWRPGEGAPIAGDLTLELEALGPSRTRATYGGHFEGRGILRWLQPLLSAEMRAGPAKELRRLKAAVESQP